MIKLLRKMYIKFISIFDREFVARALNIHHPSELKAWYTFNTTLRKDYDEYCSVREELREWVALAKNYGCYSQSELYMMINSMKNQVDFLCKNRNPADPQYVDEWFRFKKMF